jgi:hypothetical protein
MLDGENIFYGGRYWISQYCSERKAGRLFLTQRTQSSAQRTQSMFLTKF